MTKDKQENNKHAATASPTGQMSPHLLWSLRHHTSNKFAIALFCLADITDFVM